MPLLRVCALEHLAARIDMRSSDFEAVYSMMVEAVEEAYAKA
jgi:hypothetical protein